MADDVPIVYYEPGCPYSAWLRAQLFRDDEEGAEAVRDHHEHGYELSPTVVVGSEYLTNPSLRQVREAIARR